MSRHNPSKNFQFLMLFFSCLTLAFTTFATCQTEKGVQTAPVPDLPLLNGKQEFKGQILHVQKNYLEIQVPEREKRLVMLPSSLLERLRRFEGKSFDVLVNQRPTPAGFNTAIRLNDGRGLLALAEAFQDIQLLQPAERNGVQVQILPKEKRTFVFEDNCKVVNNVPTAFLISGQKYVLQPHETKAVRIGDAEYDLTLNASQFVIQKECPIPFEGGKSTVEYVLVRKQ